MAPRRLRGVSHLLLRFVREMGVGVGRQLDGAVAGADGSLLQVPPVDDQLADVGVAEVVNADLLWESSGLESGIEGLPDGLVVEELAAARAPGEDEALPFVGLARLEHLLRLSGSVALQHLQEGIGELEPTTGAVRLHLVHHLPLLPVAVGE